MERLQEIKEDRKLLLWDLEKYDWLISEVERLQAENKQLLRDYGHDVKFWRLENEKSQQKVERLEKALKEIENEDEIYFVHKIAKQTLETEWKDE
jgi:hypothetical protein